MPTVSLRTWWRSRPRRDFHGDLKPGIQASYVSPRRVADGGTKLSMSGSSSSIQRQAIPGVHLDVRELARFLAWLDQAAQSDECGLPVPDPSMFRDRTVTRWTQMIMGLAAGTERVEARLRGAEGLVDQQVSQLRHQTLHLAEQLAALYECCDRADKAQTIRLRAAGLNLRA